jgi:hypothetical protein
VNGVDLRMDVDDAEDRSKQWVREELADIFSIAPGTAAGDMHDAVTLTSRLPLTMDRLPRPTRSRAALPRLPGTCGSWYPVCRRETPDRSWRTDCALGAAQAPPRQRGRLTGEKRTPR